VTPAQRLVAARMTEDQLQEAVRTFCRDLGLLVQHVHDSRRSWLPGWPDLEIVGQTHIIWRELKSETGTLRPEQRAVGSRITKAGGNWAVWRPRDLVSGVILRQLEEIAGVQGQLWEAG
jgi:hypothetical protein